MSTSSRTTPIKYIFCANPGRAGSNYLWQIFSQVENVVSYHEPDPIMNFRPMIRFLDGDPSEMKAMMPRKLAAIQAALSKPNQVYAETNHCFIKGFGWLLPKFIPQEQIGVVILKRDKTAVAKSLARIKCDAFNEWGKRWVIHVNAKRRLTPLPDDEPMLLARYYYYRTLYRLHYWANSRSRVTLGLLSPLKNYRPPETLNIRLLEWYVDETYALAAKYMEVFPNVRYYEVQTEELNDVTKVASMLDYFGLQPSESLETVVGRPTNQMPWFK